MTPELIVTPRDIFMVVVGVKVPATVDDMAAWLLVRTGRVSIGSQDGLWVVAVQRPDDNPLSFVSGTIRPALVDAVRAVAS
jgi:hypothetical protein